MELETALALGNSSNSFVVENVKGKAFFVKNYLLKQSKAHYLLRNLIGLEKRTLNILNIQNPKSVATNGFRKYVESTKEVIKKEVKTNKLWLENGIITPKIINYDNISITSEYIPSKNFAQLINGKYNSSLLDEMFLAYQTIRQKALSKNDPYLIHCDPHGGNFLKSVEGEVFALDSSFVLKKGVTAKSLDGFVNLLFLLQLEDISGNSEIFEANARHCVKLFGNDINSLKLPKLNKASLNYFKFREGIAHKMKRRKYDFNDSSFKNYETLRKIIS